ncbi:MAG: NAD(P)(+) transhydrogenase (Re/Si-specific) subunit alpha [Rhodobiaceae bacterium]|nr:MAG: NAD(P)(+) transhydrogenase (Re/Si-specific) subunit alpha [Rhodobiaceae bacterium]
MKLAIPKERMADEPRVAASPDTVKKLIALGFDVAVEAGAGAGAHISDAAFTEAGASIASSSADALKDADVVFGVRGLDDEQLGSVKKGAVLAAILNPYGDKARVQKYADAGIIAIAMEFMPRITRAQSMDVLSSQSNLAGYKSVLDAAAEFSRAMPMMMTAAGTIAPARVFVFGAGVAGLQAIATAKRLGAIVSATDVRRAAGEQIESLGGTFIMVESDDEDGETAAGYAKEMSEDYKRRQAELVSEHIKKQDIVITTALIPGRAAPVLITEDMVKSMKPGSIIVDLAVEQGGNCPLSKAGEIVEVHGVKIIGHRNMAGRLSVDASALYARNLLNFISPQIDEESKTLKLDWEDETVTGTALTRDGAIIHPALTGENA